MEKLILKIVKHALTFIYPAGLKSQRFVEHDKSVNLIWVLYFIVLFKFELKNANIEISKKKNFLPHVNHSFYFKWFTILVRNVFFFEKLFRSIRFIPIRTSRMHHFHVWPAWSWQITTNFWVFAEIHKFADCFSIKVYIWIRNNISTIQQ